MVKVAILFKYFFLIIILSTFQIGVYYILPSPFSKLNIVLPILLLILINKEWGGIVWLNFIIYFLIELYAATPFGVILISSTIGILLTFWLYKFVFTNRSWYAYLALSAMSLAGFRIIYASCLVFINIFFDNSYVLSTLLVSILWELLFSLIFSILIYFAFVKNNSYRGKTPGSIFRV